MHTPMFFRLFPPPKFLAMKHAGIDISDEAIHVVEYDSSTSPHKIEKYTKVDLEPGIVEGGNFRNEEALVKILTNFNKKFKLSYVKASVSEEKSYLFQTDVPSHETKSIRQNIEFKLEENVPLPASEALFYFDLLPESMTQGVLRASVSVVPQAYIEQYSHILNQAGMSAVEFEVVPKAISRAAVSRDSDRTYLIVHMMRHKTGLYIVSDGVVCFTSTVGSGMQDGEHVDESVYIENLSREINRVYSYWLTHGGELSPIASIILTGKNAGKYESQLQNVINGAEIHVEIAHVWQNIFKLNSYVPPISEADSLEYAVAVGLAMPLLI